MKSIKKFTTIAILALGLTFASCSSDDGESGIPFAKEGTITAQVEGKTITTLLSNTKVVFQEEEELLYMTGQTAEEEAFLIIINDYKGPGTYMINGAKGAIDSGVTFGRKGKVPNNYQIWNVRTNIEGSSAKIIVTEQTEKLVKGTISFKGKNEEDGNFLEVKNGSFFIKVNQ